MIKIKSLTKSFQENIIFKDFNLNLPCKGIFIIIGDSGAGKSTLLNIIYNIITIYRGEVIIGNRNIKSFSDSENAYYKNKNISMMFQSNDLINILTPRENILLVSNNNLEIEKLAREFEVTELLDKETKYLSLGEKSRINLIRSLINYPEIILLDEPLASLDSKMATKVFDYLKQLSSNSLVIFNSHIINGIKEYLDGEIIFKDNKIISIINSKAPDKTPEILSMPHHSNIFEIGLKFLKSNLKNLSILGLFNSIGLIIMLLGIITSSTIKTSVNDILPSIFPKDQLNVSNYYNEVTDYEISQINDKQIVDDLKKISILKEEKIYLISGDKRVIEFSSEIILDSNIPDNEIIITTTEKDLKSFNYLIINNYQYSFSIKYQVINGSSNNFYSNNLSFFREEFYNIIPESEFILSTIAKYDNAKIDLVKNYFSNSNYLLKKSINLNHFYLEKRLIDNNFNNKIFINDLFFTNGSEIYLNALYPELIKFNITTSNKITNNSDIIISNKLAKKINSSNFDLIFENYQSIFSNRPYLDTKKINFKIVDTIESEELIIYQKFDWNLKLLEESFDILPSEMRSKEVVIYSFSPDLNQEIKKLQLINSGLEIRSYFLETLNYFNDFAGFLVMTTSIIAILIAILASLIIVISVKYLYLVREKDFMLLRNLGFTFKDLIIIKAMHNLFIGTISFIFALFFLVVLNQMKNQNTKLNAFSSENGFILDLLGNIEITPFIIFLTFIYAFFIPLLILIISILKESAFRKRVSKV